MQTFAAAPALYLLVQQIGGFGSAPRQFAYPLGIAIGADGRVAVTDTQSFWNPIVVNNRIQVFNADGTLAGVFGGPGAGDGQFDYPMGVAIDRNGRILVADSGNNRLQLFNADFTHVKTVGSAGNFDVLDPVNRDANGNYIGAAPTLDRFWFPTRVALKPGTRLNDPTDTAGLVAVVDNSNHRVVVLDAMLTPKFAFGTFGVDGNLLGNFEYPLGVGMDAERIYVADPENHRIQIFDLAGRPLAAFGSSGAQNTEGDLQAPRDVQPDGAGNLVVADTDRSRVLVLHPDPATPQSPRCRDLFAAQAAGRCAILATDGTWYDARVVGRFGRSDGEFVMPQAVAVDAAGRIAVADTVNHRFEVFNGANLRVRSATLSTSGPVISGQTVGVTLTVDNDGAFDLTVTPDVRAGLAGRLGAVSPATVPAGSSRDFALTFDTDDIGSLVFAAAAAAQPSAAGPVLRTSAIATTPLVVSPAPGPKMFVTVAADTALATPGTPINVDVRVKNTGSVPLSSIAAAIDVAPGGLVTLQSSAPMFEGPLAPAALRTFRFCYTAAAVGRVSFHASASATAGTISAAAAAAADAIVTIGTDAQQPHTAITVSPPGEPTGWNRTPVAVTLDASDNVSVAAVNYAVIGFHAYGARVPGSRATFTIDDEGGTEISYWAEDTAALIEPRHVAAVRIDSVPPQIARAGVAPAPNAAGWVNRFPTVSFLASDFGSGIASVTPSVVVTTNGAGQVVKGRAIDTAGNVADTQNVVNVDTLAPSLQCTPDRPPNDQGWYSANVKVTCVAADQPGLSGLASVRASCNAAPVTGATTASCEFTSDGVFTFLGEAIDNAGNVTAQPITIRIDRTPPTVTCGTARGGDLWPPNHQLVPWDTFVQVQDLLSGSASFTLVRALSSAWLGGTGDATMSGDVVDFVLGTPDTSGAVRSERAGVENGRTYTLVYEGRDAAGNLSSCAVITRSVPHDSGGD